MSAALFDIADHRQAGLMCHITRCPTCGKLTWAGCGRHADILLAYPEEARCVCGR